MAIREVPFLVIISLEEPHFHRSIGPKGIFRISEGTNQLHACAKSVAGWIRQEFNSRYHTLDTTYVHSTVFLRNPTFPH